ncbi:DGQHR domain-containing protein (plasmid) [Pseudoalteromonas shioyasakiensis]|nr:DGQHR domain-containing protein [Pseudoalteromonas shioyasakiensis]
MPVSISAKDLLKICQPIRAEVLDNDLDNNPLNLSIKKSTGTQRQLGNSRPEEIKDYIKTGVAAFPNSIIIGANISEDGFLLEENQRTWKVEDNCLKISKGALTAAIIDGQHRLAGFELLEEDDLALNENLLCSIYLNIPMTYHAQIFSIINSTQRKVHKNLIYQLYQIDMDEKEPKYWSPEVLSVYLSRALGTDTDSILKNRIVLAIDNKDTEKDWNISLSSMVEGILKLISESPQRDRDSFYSKKMESKIRRDVGEDNAVWRERYLEMRDKSIYEDLRGFFNTCFNMFDEDSAYRSTVGCAALLEALRELLSKPKVNYTLIDSRLTELIENIDQSKMPKDKVTKNQSTFRDVFIASFIRCNTKLKIEHKFYKNNLADFDCFLINN